MPDRGHNLKNSHRRDFMANIIIRDALLSDVELCQTIEISAAKKFLALDSQSLKDLAHGVPLNAVRLIIAIQKGLCFISEIDNVPVGFIALKQFSKSWYIEEISVAEHAQSQGVGNALLAYIKMLAEIKQVMSINLITFREVAWNMPYYSRKGYREMAIDTLSEQFLSLWQKDNQYFESKHRICMQLKIDLDKF